MTTKWTMVREAADLRSSESERALQALCQAYWYPIYVFVRREGHEPPDAEDVTQKFFYRLLKKEGFAVADEARGKLRTFLIRSLRNFLIDQRRRATRLKRGGGRQLLSLDEAEDLYQSSDKY